MTMPDLTAWLSGGTLALCCWILREVHLLRVLAMVQRSEHRDLERRVQKLEKHAGL